MDESFSTISDDEIKKVKGALEHFGVPGMRWGVRRSSSQLSGSKKNKKGSRDYENARKARKKGSKNLSNKELKDLNNRLNMEKQFKDLNPSNIKKGANVVKAVVAVAGTATTIYAFAKSPLVKDISSLVQKHRK